MLLKIIEIILSSLVLDENLKLKDLGMKVKVLGYFEIMKILLLLPLHKMRMFMIDILLQIKMMKILILS
jgi:hypothetical protein